MIKPEPTKRFYIDISHECNIKCKFCYHLHTYDKWKNTRKTFEQIKQEIDAGKSRGNNYLEITGGEPTIYPYIEDVIKYALFRDIKTCIITNGIVSEKKTQSIIDAGIDDWLISRHGLVDTHNEITNCRVALEKQIRFLEQLKNNKKSFRFNCVITKYNQNDLLSIAVNMGIFTPRIVNFINFNPHTNWITKDLEAKDVIADLRVVENNLNQAIEFLEDNYIGVNIRYYPMCRIAEKNRKNICNDLQVCWDPYEWDYPRNPKTYEHFRHYSINELSNLVEEKGEPCCRCDLQNICGGINKTFRKFNNAIYNELCIAQDFDGDKNDFYHYRKNNILTLEEK